MAQIDSGGKGEFVRGQIAGPLPDESRGHGGDEALNQNLLSDSVGDVRIYPQRCSIHTWPKLKYIRTYLAQA